jgi:hypothetical protein
MSAYALREVDLSVERGSRAPSGARWHVIRRMSKSTKIIIPGPRMSVSGVGKQARGLETVENRLRYDFDATTRTNGIAKCESGHWLEDPFALQCVRNLQSSAPAAKIVGRKVLISCIANQENRL